MNLKKILHSLLSENETDISSVRVMSFIALFTGVCIAIYGVYQGKDLAGLAQVCGVFIGAAFVGKVTQKFAEKD